MHTEPWGRPGSFSFLSAATGNALQICKGLFGFCYSVFVLPVALFPEAGRLTPSGSRAPGPSSTAQVCAPCAGGQRSRTGGDALEVKLLVQGHRSQRRRGVEGSRGCLSRSAQLAGRMPHSLLPVCPACSKKAEPISLSDLRGWIYLCRLKNGATSLPAFQFKLLSLWGGAGEGKQGDG